MDCCSALKQVNDESKRCLCILIKDRNDPSLGLNINVTLALKLPGQTSTMKRKTIGFMFFVLLVLALDVGVQSAKAECYTPSAGFKGACFSSDNCARQCMIEGHPGGECQGLFPPRCMCIC